MTTVKYVACLHEVDESLCVKKGGRMRYAGMTQRIEGDTESGYKLAWFDEIEKAFLYSCTGDANHATWHGDGIDGYVPGMTKGVMPVHLEVDEQGVTRRIPQPNSFRPRQWIWF